VADTAFGAGHPFSRTPAGASRATRLLSSEELRTFYRAQVRRVPHVVSVVGPISPEAVASIYFRSFGAPRADGAAAKHVEPKGGVLPAMPALPRELGQPGRFVESREPPRAVLAVLAARGGTTVARRLLNAELMRLSAPKGVGVTLLGDPYAGAWAVAYHFGAKREQLVEQLAALHAYFDRQLKTPLSKELLLRAKRQLAWRYARRLGGQGGHAGYLVADALAGRSPGSYRDFLRELEAIDAASASREMARILARERRFAVVAGPVELTPVLQRLWGETPQAGRAATGRPPKSKRGGRRIKPAKGSSR
jgi:hypothetical protein